MAAWESVAGRGLLTPGLEELGETRKEAHYFIIACKDTCTCVTNECE